MLSRFPNTISKFCQNCIRVSQSALLGFHQDERLFLHTSSISQVDGKALKMPSLSPTMMEGTIVKWLKSEGESITAGDVICDIQTDKAVISFEVDDDLILAKILVKEDVKDIKVGTTIALTVEEGEDWKSVEMPTDEITDSTESKEMSGSKAVEQTSSINVSNTLSSHVPGPSVRLLLEKYGLNSSEVSSSGPHGMVLKGDVLKVIKDRNLSPIEKATVVQTSLDDIKPSKKEESKQTKIVSINAAYIDIELSNMRKTIARRLTESKQQISHTYSTAEVLLNPLLEFRKTMKSDGVSVSVNDVLIKCVAASLQQHPEINCVWKGNELVSHFDVDISIAVATPSGLITPIVRRAHALGIEEIANVVHDLATRAKENKLKLNEFQGGTFTISNLGMFGIKEFTAIINPPQCAILAVGGGQITLNEDGVPVTKMRATLSYDQMAISDDSAADFLQSFQSIIENPINILLRQRKSANYLLGLL